MNEDMAEQEPVNTLLSLKNTGKHQQTNHIKTIHLEWTHPHRGRIVEEVCPEHEQQVLQALKTLGIGCSGTLGKLGLCWRCIYAGFQFRQFVDQIDMPAIFED